MANGTNAARRFFTGRFAPGAIAERTGRTMRLQSAIFMLEDTLLCAGGAPRAGVEKVLSLFKMESIWMYAVTEGTHAEGEAALKSAGLSDYFRGVLSQDIARCAPDSGTMFERAMKRLHSDRQDTVVFAGRLAAIEHAKEAGFRTVAVRGKADAAEWDAMCAAATETLEQYGDYLAE